MVHFVSLLRFLSSAELTIRLSLAVYEILPCFWGQGIMTEAVEAVLRYCFDHLRVPSVVVDPFVGNTASIKIVKHFGGVFKELSVRKHWRGPRVEQEVWVISRDD